MCRSSAPHLRGVNHDGFDAAFNEIQADKRAHYAGADNGDLLGAV
jgi:hypothetical protein